MRGYARRGRRRGTAAVKKEGGGRRWCGRGAGYGGDVGVEAARGGGSEGGVRGEGLTLEGSSAVKGGWDRGSARRGGTSARGERGRT
jgi:hypothetical protein